ncbi:hypothetical protein [Desulfobacter postgatei]|uniref:Uncharacterized protein n=1 Tax=Desulfobacter postgatei 2ac9 TaxID=879212 RepID=I5B3L6_9BACT|nr:hypothetical protein [Desulfobacter postgatei]EIM64079.1 hypothetical protein DespoDRAFT_02196 [Desulfobacter postgatei 2ac9]
MRSYSEIIKSLVLNDSDLKMATAKQEKYLDNQTGTNPGTIAQFGNKKGTLG